MTEMTLAEFERIAGLIAVVSEQVGHLPAIALKDWPDRAAKCMARLCPGAQAVVQICKLDEHGGVVREEATGIAAEGMDANELASFRSRASRLTTLGFHVDLNILQARPLVGSLDTLCAGRDWRGGSLGRLMSLPATGFCVVGVAAMGAADPGRAIVVIMGLPAGNRDAHVIKLRAVMGVLQARARMAMGDKPTVNSDWVTEKEQKVLDRLILGESVRQIAESTDRSQHTIHDHVKALHKKLNASSRGELISRALGYIQTCTGVRRNGNDSVTELKPGATSPRLDGAGA